MKGYVIFQEDVFDHDAFESYKKLSPRSITAYGGEFIVRGGNIDVLEGEFSHERVVVIAFPSPERARAWYNSEDYADARELRLQISKGSAILVTGYEYPRG